jgi:hypothetical protein
VEAIPGSPLNVARLRVGLPLTMTDPTTFTAEEWAAQGKEVREILGHTFIDGELILLVAWDAGWQSASQYADLDALTRYQQRLRQEGDLTDIVALAQQQRQRRPHRGGDRAGAEDEEQEEEEDEQRDSRARGQQRVSSEQLAQRAAQQAAGSRQPGQPAVRRSMRTNRGARPAAA